VLNRCQLIIRSLRRDDWPIIYESTNDLSKIITRIYFSADSRKVLVAGEYRELQLHTEQALLTFKSGTNSRTWDCAFSIDDSLVGSVHSNKKVLIWDTNTGALKNRIATSYVPRYDQLLCSLCLLCANH